MPKRVTNQELETLEMLFPVRPPGLGVAELTRISGTPDRRTLQRRLAQLVAAGRLVRDGAGRASRYRLAPALSYLPDEGNLYFAREPEPGSGSGESDVSVSAAGAEVRALVRRRARQRTPVGYDAGFLDRYQPNRSSYLDAALRARLHEMGRSPFAEQPAGTYARDILNRLLIDLSWASSRLEGNTYNWLDTQNLIEFGQVAEGKSRREARMILNHKAAIEMLVENADEVGFDPLTFRNLHAALAEELLADRSAVGRLRTRPVGIGGSVFLPLADPHRIEEYFRRLLAKAAEIRDPFEQAFFVMVQIPYLQPFDDVNKRVSRLGANIPLIKHNLSPLSFVEVPESAYVEGTLAVYELNRVELLRDVFVWAYDRSCRRYVAVKEFLPQPDPLRMKYREALLDVVAGMVRRLESVDVRSIRDAAAPLVRHEDLNAFVAMAFNDLKQLHEGNFVRYRLRHSEYERWREAQGREAG